MVSLPYLKIEIGQEGTVIQPFVPAMTGFGRNTDDLRPETVCQNGIDRDAGKIMRTSVP